jgi:hypothetical protein
MNGKNHKFVKCLFLLVLLCGGLENAAANGGMDYAGSKNTLEEYKRCFSKR